MRGPFVVWCAGWSWLLHFLIIRFAGIGVVVGVKVWIVYTSNVYFWTYLLAIPRHFWHEDVGLV